MVLYRMPERWLIIGIVPAIGLLALGAGMGTGASRPAQAAQANAGTQTPNQRLHELMTERYEILQSEVKSLELSLKSGRADLAEWRKANVALFKARADLAADITEQIEIYEEMVDLLRTSEQATHQRIDAGQAPQTDLRQARLATVEAQIALEKLRMSQP